MGTQAGLTKRVVARVHGSNLTAVFLNSVAPITASSSLASKNIYRWTGVQAGYITIAFAVGTWLIIRHMRDLDERRATNVPLYAALVSGFTWAGGAVMNAILVSVSGGRSVEVAAAVLRNILMGSAAASISFLLVERVMVPTYAEAFRAQGVQRTGLSLRRRLVLTWLTGSAMPLLLFGTVLFARSSMERAELSSYWWVYVLVGLITGTAMTLTVVTSIVRPITELQAAIDHVSAGSLDTHVAVDDGTEIGQLQAGFNRMVDGLRERDRLHDLFGRHVGTEVAHQAMHGSGSLGGEQCEATVLFVDLTASTQLGEHLPPTEVVALLNEFFAVVVGAVREQGGWVNKFEGDAALCVFGPPVGHIDHAARALCAAAAMRDGLRRLQTRRPEVDAGIGVATGTVVAGNVGADDRFEFTVIGDPVNTAARVSELAKAANGRVLTTAAAVAAASGTAGDWVATEPVLLRGRSQPTALYELQ